MADPRDQEQDRDQRRRSFGPTVLTGLLASVLAAVAAGRDWATASVSGAGATGAGGLATSATVKGSASAPLAIALALVGLAAWGVVLVLRGKARRLVAVVGAVASAGVLAAAVAALHRVRLDAVRAVEARSAAGSGTDASLTGWYAACLVGALVATLAFVVAVRAAPRWPAMGSRYDAPAGRAVPREEQDPWRALDEGRDPTDPHGPDD